MNTGFIALSLLDPLYTLFGMIIGFIYSVFKNYGVSIILFTLLVRGLMLPLNLKQHKSSLMQRALQPQLNELQRYYGDDKQGYTQAQMELFNKHKISMFGGCLPSLVSLILIWPVYRIISGPLHYIMHVSAENLQAIGNFLAGQGFIAESALTRVKDFNIPIMQALHEHPSALAEVVNQGLMKTSDLLDLNFLGLNLGLNPTLNPSQLFGEQKWVYLPLLILPILATVTTFLQSRFSQQTMGVDKKKSKAEKEAELRNPALKGQTQDAPTTAESTMKSMTYMMPIMTLVFTFTMPAAMSLYWIVGNLVGIFQAWLFDTIYTKPMAERQAISDAEYEAGILEKAKVGESTSPDLDSNAKKKRRKSQK